MFFLIALGRFICDFCDFSVTLLIHELLEFIEIGVNAEECCAEDKKLGDEHEDGAVYLTLRRKEKPCGSKCHRRAKC